MAEHACHELHADQLPFTGNKIYGPLLSKDQTKTLEEIFFVCLNVGFFHGQFAYISLFFESPSCKLPLWNNRTTDLIHLWWELHSYIFFPTNYAHDPLNLPGQSPWLQDKLWFAGPRHIWPPLIGAGLLQNRLLCCTPLLQVFEQAVQLPHALQAPSTKVNKDESRSLASIHLWYDLSYIHLHH